MPSCAECKFGRITLHSSGDKCEAAQNVDGLHPYALRHDEMLCGEVATWFMAKVALSAIYKAEVVK